MKTRLLLNPQQVRKDFPILEKKMNGKQLVYLDNAASSLTPQQVLNAMNKYYQEFRANVHRGIYEFSEKATEEYENAHKIVADFINASPEEIIFTRNTTESLNLLAYTLTQQLEKDDEIVLTEMEHHSNIVPWQLAAKKDLKLKFIKVTEEGNLDMQHAASIINKKTKILSVMHVSNVLGTINPVKELGRLAHKNSAIFIVDAAQSIPHMPIDVKAIDADFLAFSGHKMLGPTGIGVLYGKKHLLEKLPPFLTGGGTISEVTFQQTRFREPPARYEAGTPPIAEAIGLAAAIKYLNSIGMENIHEYTSSLTSIALEEIKKIKNIEIHALQAEEKAAVLSFNLPGIHPHDVAAILDKEGIAIRAGHMCCMPLVKQVLKQDSVCRASFHIYNTKDDIYKLIEGIKKAKEVFEK